MVCSRAYAAVGASIADAFANRIALIAKINNVFGFLQFYSKAVNQITSYLINHNNQCRLVKVKGKRDG